MSHFKSKLTILILSLMAQTATASEVTLDFQIRGAKFKQVITLAFDPHVTLSQTLKGFTDPKIMNSLSDFILDNGIQRSETFGSTMVYTLYTEVDLTPIKGKTFSNCTLLSNPTDWSQVCEVDLKRGNASRGLRSGRSDFQCQARNGDGPLCTMTYQGEAKDINYIFVQRRAQRLAVSGGAQTAEDYLRVFHMLDGQLSESLARDQFQRTELKAMTGRFIELGHQDMDRTPSKYEKVRSGATYSIKGQWKTDTTYSLDSKMAN